MSILLAEAFDIAIIRRQMGEPLADILADFPQYADELHALLQTTASLDVLKAVEMPSAEALTADRTQFINLVQNSTAQAVSIGLMERINRWISQQFPSQKTDPSFISKEKQPMFGSFLVKAALTFTLVFGSAGGTMVAAAQSLPDSPLYPVKIGLEQARLSLVTNPTAEAILHLEMAQERVDEMVKLAEKGASIDESVVEQMQLHLDKALALANQSSVEARQELLTRAQEMLQTQEDNLAQVRVEHEAQKALDEAQTTLEQTQEQVQNAIQNGIDKGENGQGIMPNSPIATPTHMMDNPTETPEPEDTETPEHRNPTMTPPWEPTETPEHGNTPEPEDTETPEHRNPTMTPPWEPTETPEHGNTPEPEETETPEHHTPTITPPWEPTETPELEETETPDYEDTPEPEETETPDHDETPEPEETPTVPGFPTPGHG